MDVDGLFVVAIGWLVCGMVSCGDGKLCVCGGIWKAAVSRGHLVVIAGDCMC